MTITVNNIDEAGSLTLDQASPRVGDTVAASLTDPDGATSSHSWQWQQGDGPIWASVAGATAASYTVQSSDIGKSLKATVQYTDPQGPGKTASAQTADLVQNDPPTFSAAAPVDASLEENNTIGASISTPLAASDPNNDPLTYSVEGHDAASFTVDSNGQITATASLDHESKASYSFTARVTDPAGGADTITVNVSVTNVEEDGTVRFDSDAKPEHKTALTASLTDPDGKRGQPELAVAVCRKRHRPLDRHPGRHQRHPHAHGRRRGPLPEGQRLLHRRPRRPGGHCIRHHRPPRPAGAQPASRLRRGHHNFQHQHQRPRGRQGRTTLHGH